MYVFLNCFFFNEIIINELKVRTTGGQFMSLYPDIEVSVGAMRPMFTRVDESFGR